MLLQSKIEAELRQLNLDLVEFELIEDKIDEFILRLTINDKERHIGHEQCILATKMLCKKLPEINDYSIEVFSPGIGRELRTDKEFEIFTNKYIEVILKKELIYYGILKHKKANYLEIELEGGEIKSIPMGEVAKVCLALVKQDTVNAVEISLEDI